MTTETTPATAKAKSTGKRKIKNSGKTDTAPITLSSSSNSHNHESNGLKSTSKSTSNSHVDLTGETVSVDDAVQVSPSSNGVNVSTKKKTKNEDNHKKKIKDEKDEKDGSLLYQIPMNRVSRIIKSEDPNVGITQEAVYIINKASEKFLQVFTTEAYASAFLDHKKHIDYKHLSSVVGKRKRFDFLSDFVPEKLKAEEALSEIQAVEN